VRASDWAIIVAVAVGALGFLASTYLSLLTRRQQLRFEEMKFDIEYRRLYESKEEAPAPSLLYEVINQQRQTDSALQSVARMLESTERGLQNSSVDPAQLVREISHSLNTPLSQIEAATLSLQSRDISENALGQYAERVLNSLEVCKAFLYAFRQIVNVPTASPKGAFSSLESIVATAMERHPRFVSARLAHKIDIAMPVSGYPDSYLLAILLPLVENAVESAAPDTTIDVSALVDGTGFVLSASNAYEGPWTSNELNAGFTTKSGHEGLGLSVVQRLVGVYEHATLSLKEENGFVRATVVLPPTK
jgi:signal transduction histidine kinase